MTAPDRGAATADRIAAAFLAACRDELSALKPGNVHRFADGHRMTVADFERSAVAAAPAVAVRGTTVGTRILAAIAATRAAVGTNTNLGIVLLAAPLACAAEVVAEEENAGSCIGETDAPPAAKTAAAQTAATPTMAAAKRSDRLRAALGRVLAALDVADAEAAFRAIALAAPAGLGRVEDHDVARPATTTLLAAMAAAADRDRIAFQYASGYADVLGTGLAILGDARRRGLGREDATTAVDLAFLAAFPDSHIVRKHGAAAAEAVRREAEALVAAGAAATPALHHAALLAFDARLKAAGLNPGTTADLTVATLFADRLLASAPDEA